MRKLPESEPPTQLDMLTHEQLGLIVQTREYQVITPIFGGGVVPGEIDPLTQVRGSEIRGHLRFWWRATRGGNPAFEGDLKKMKLAEDAIWGKASSKEEESDLEQGDGDTKSAPIRSVQIDVTVNNRGEGRRPFIIQKSSNGKNVPRPAGVPGYVVFPLLPTNDDLRQKTKEQIEKEMKCVQRNVRFMLKITYHQEYHDDIQAALWAWENFGGIGARTRRGFGALRLLKINGEQIAQGPVSNQPEDIKAWLNKQAKLFVVVGVWPKGVPHLEQTLSCEFSQSGRDVLFCWDSLAKSYASFRQSRTEGNTGRSNWPEAEAIRMETGRRAQAFDKRTGRMRNKYHPLGHPEKFPRAAFGLPIIFHFKDNGDPPDTTLQGKEPGNERLASPLILRPLVFGNGITVGLAALLKGSVLPPLVLKEANKSVNAQLNESDLTKLDQLNREKLKNETDVLQAFLNSLGGKR